MYRGAIELIAPIPRPDKSLKRIKKNTRSTIDRIIVGMNTMMEDIRITRFGPYLSERNPDAKQLEC